MLLRISNNNSAAQGTGSKLRFPVRTARKGRSLWQHSSGNPGRVRGTLGICVHECPAPPAAPGRDKDKQQCPREIFMGRAARQENLPDIWIHMQKPPRDIWAISRMVSDKSSLSFYSLRVWVCGWGLLLHEISTRCAEKSVKSRILKAFNTAPSFDENSKQTTPQKFLSLHPFKRANSLQVRKKKKS